MSQPCAVLAQAYDVAYRTVAPAIHRASPRVQSDEILRAVARFCQAADLHDLDHAERIIVATLAGAASDPVRLTRLIAAINAEAGDDDFPAARLDPRGRHGWAAAKPGQIPRIICRPPWSEPTDDVLAELRCDTDHLCGERLHAQLKLNIEPATDPFFLVPENPALDAHEHHMMPTAIAACYLLAFEARIRDLEDALAEERTNHAECR
jgi:hypothetical protein